MADELEKKVDEEIKTDAFGRKTYGGGQKKGQPKIYIDKDEFEGLCKDFNTEQDIADHFRCSPDTIYNWCKKTYGASFSSVYASFKADGRKSLRRRLMDRAYKNDVVLIFTCKNILGMSDDPKKYEKDETVEDKLDKLMNIVTGKIDALGDPDEDKKENES